MTTLAKSRPAIVNVTDARAMGAAAGLAAGPLFLAIVGLLTWAELDDLHRLGWSYTKSNNVPWPSGLALGAEGWIQVVNFVATGLLLLTFARGFRHELNGLAGRIGAVLLTVLATALTLSAFPTDHAAAAGKSPDTWHGVIHSAAFVGVALPALIAPAFVALALRHRPGWRATAAASGVVPILLVASFALQSQLHDIAFTLFLATMFAWIALLASRLRT